MALPYLERDAMTIGATSRLLLALVAVIGAGAGHGAAEAAPADGIGRVEVSTVPFSPNLVVRSATYTPSGKVLVTYADRGERDRRRISLGVMDDDGEHLRPVFSGVVPARPKDNGLRFMVFADNKRVFLGDFIVECAPSLDACARSKLVPVDYPSEVAESPQVLARWSEMIVAPDNRHIAWTTLLSSASALAFVGELQRTPARYRVVNARIISTQDPFGKDPAHPDGVLPIPVRGGEVKQFVHGGAAISLVGAVRRDTPDSVVQDLATGAKQAITDTPGYTETTIFSPDERLGLTMTTRFSPRTDLAVLGLMPRPYPDSLNVGLSMFAYTYSVTGVRQARAGNVGPALIDVRASETQSGYQGVDLHTADEWVFRSPMSWSPDGRKGMWIEGRRGDGATRIQVVRLPDYHPARPVAPKPTPEIPYGVSDLSTVGKSGAAEAGVAVKVYGRRSGYIQYRAARGAIEKTYVDYSDDGRSVYSGVESTAPNPLGGVTYTAKLKLAGPTPGVMDLKLTFGPLRARLPAEIVFAPDAAKVPQSYGYVEYGGQRLSVETLAP